MIDLGRPSLHGEGVTIFGDHAQSNRFYCLADRPRVRTSSDGVPELMLLKYRLDPTLHQALGAGLLSLTVDLGVEPTLLEKLRRRLSLRDGLSGPVEIGPVMAESGSCQLVLINRSLSDQDSNTSAAAPFALVERILGAATPSLYGDNAATFQAVLSPEGVGVVEGALRGGGLPIGVVYTLQTTGLRPALRAEIAARWKDVYEFYENRLHGGKLLLATDIGPTLEDLVHAEAIQISIDELVPESERSETYQRALDQVQRYVLDEFFKPTLGQAPPPEDSDDGPLQTIGKAIKDFAGFFSLTYSLREVQRDELKTFRYHLGVARAERLTLAPQGTFGVLLGAAAADVVDRLIIEVEPGPSPEMKFDIASSIDLAAEGIDHLELSLRYGDRDERLMLDVATPRRQVSVWYRQESGPEVTYDYEVHFGAGVEGRFDRVTSEPRTTANRVIRLNPRELYQKVVLRVVAKGVPLDRYPSVVVDLRAHDPVEGWTVTDTLELDANHLERIFETRARLNARIRFERRLRYFDTQGSEVAVEWDDAEPGVLVVGDPLPEVVDVQILGSARFGTEVRRLIVELRPNAEPEKVSTFLLTADKPSATWSWAAGSEVRRDYEYRVTVHTVRHEVREGKWLPGTPGKLLVGEGIARLRQVEMMLLGPSLQVLGVLAMKVRFAFEDPEAGLFAEEEMLVQDTSKSIRWSYPVADPARQQYTYQFTFIRKDGSTDTSDPVKTSDLLVIKTLS